MSYELRVVSYEFLVTSWKLKIQMFKFKSVISNPRVMMMNCFCGMVDRRKAFSLISSPDHCQRSSPSWIFDTPRAGFEPESNLSSVLVEWSCAVVITTTPWRHELRVKIHGLKFTNCELNITSYESKFTSYHFKSASSRIM